MNIGLFSCENNYIYEMNRRELEKTLLKIKELRNKRKAKDFINDTGMRLGVWGIGNG